jgi:DNA-binding transcriptional regulator YhcF (GntR family)
MLPFIVQIEDGLPVSDQIIQAIRKAMLTGQLAAGDAFPSVRTLSQELKISPTTAHKVVATLKDAGYLGSRPGIGMVVKSPELPEHDERLDHLQPLCQELLKEAEDLHLEFDDVVEALRRASNGGSSTPAAPHASEQSVSKEPRS